MKADLKKIACIDDDVSILAITAMALEMVGGFEVASYRGGAAALAAMPFALPDLIMLDVMMPGTDGPQTLALLRAVPSLAKIPVIFLTARIQSPDMERYRLLGAIGVIAKPFDPITLGDQIRALWQAIPQEGRRCDAAS
jgi:two-component system OmpR family response regulator